jgi:hypothetical protein
MDHDVRGQVARCLGLTLATFGDDPARQSWRILNRDRIGLQARTHHLLQMASPFARNNGWREILVSTARRHGLAFDPDMRETDIEKIIFEHVADRLVAGMARSELLELDGLIDASPALVHALSSINLSQNAMRIVFKGLRRSDMIEVAVRGPDPAPSPSPAVEFGQRIHRYLGAPFWGPSISRGIRLVRERLSFVSSALCDACLALARGRHRVLPAISLIYLQDLVDASLDEFESVRL